MATVTLKSLHNCLKLLENASELKRRLPSTSNPRTLKEGLYELSRLVAVDEAVFKDPQNIAALIGAQRFVMIWGEPSATDHVARVFDNSRVLLTGLASGMGIEHAAVGQMAAGPQQGGAMAALTPAWAHPLNETSVALATLKAERDASLDDLKTLLSGNVSLTCRLFRALFEQIMGFALVSGGQQKNVSLVSELTSSREHSRTFLSTALFILGAEIDRDELMSFMLQQGLFGMPIFEHMLQTRDFCDAFHSSRAGIHGIARDRGSTTQEPTGQV